MDLVPQSHWDTSYDTYNYHIANDDVTEWVKLYSSVLTKKTTFFELGCYPGRYLSFFGKLGLTVNGIDLTPRIETDFKAWLSGLNINTGIIEKGDVLNYAATSGSKFDIVASFGFIEHFENFTEIIKLHDKLLQDDGFIIITTPNFRGIIQRTLHTYLDYPNLQLHNLDCMRPDIWKSEFRKLGYSVVFSGYFGNFNFWINKENKSMIKRIITKAIRKATPILRQLPNSSFYSPYCGIIVKKIS